MTKLDFKQFYTSYSIQKCRKSDRKQLHNNEDIHSQSRHFAPVIQNENSPPYLLFLSDVISWAHKPKVQLSLYCFCKLSPLNFSQIMDTSSSDSDLSSVDMTDILEDLLGAESIQPYQFEPTETSSEEEGSGDDEPAAQEVAVQEDRLTSLFW